MNIKEYLVCPQDSIKDVIRVIDRNKDGIALVVDTEGRLNATITDGDIRRFLLSGASIAEPCRKVMNDKALIAEASTPRDHLIRMMKHHRIRHIPLVDSNQEPVGIIGFKELIYGEEFKTVAVIMAGGEGTRLRPLTETIPKPMIQLGGRPLLEKIVENLQKAGVSDICISVNYRADIIERHFGDGSDFNVRIRYLEEAKPLGTAGALSLLDGSPSGPVLVINGDVVTNVNFERFLEFHRHHRAAMSMAAMDYNLNIPYGVLELAGHYVVNLEEKPRKRFLCNAGIYILAPEIIGLVPTDTCYDMTDLLRDVIRRGLPVAAFPIHEYWVDIGDKEDLKRANKDFENSVMKAPRLKD